MKKLISIFLFLIIVFSFAACVNEGDSPIGGGAASKPLESSADSSLGGDNTENTVMSKPILYIGNDEAGYKEYPLELDYEVTPQMLIFEMSKLTGWNIDLADHVTSGKGGMTVCFAKTCALFVGPPEPQKDEFFMHDVDTLAHTLLDSIKKTLQMNFAEAADGLDIYYCMEGDKPLSIDGIQRTWPLDEPYKW